MKNSISLFFVTFVTAFVTMALVSIFFDRWFEQTGFHWDTTSTTAAIVALVLTFVLKKKKQ